MIKEEEYEIRGYVKKECICDKCNTLMAKLEFLQDENLENPTYSYRMKCPKCGKEEIVDTENLQDQFILVKKEEK